MNKQSYSDERGARASVLLAQPPSRSQNKGVNTLYYWIVAALVVVVAFGIFAYRATVYKTEISQFSLSANASDAAGISADSHFLLKSTADLTPQVLEKFVRIVPAVDFTVKKISAAETDNRYEIIPDKPLASETIYSVEIDKGPIADHDFSWAYQVKAPFQVVSSLPRNTATEVPLNSGIEIDFNREDIVSPENFITFDPPVKGRFEVVQSKVRFIPNIPFAEKTLYTIHIQKGLGAKDTTDVMKEDVDIQFETQNGRYAKGNEANVYFSRAFSEFKPSEPVVFSMQGGAGTVQATVYKFNTVEEYQKILQEGFGQNSWRRYGNQLPELLAKQESYFTGSLSLEKVEYYTYLRLPQLVPTGFYAIMVNSNGYREVSWFQVNAAASFTAYAGEKSLVWLKDIGTEQAIPNIPIYLDNRQVGITAADGVALFDTPPELIVSNRESPPSGPRKFLIARTPETPLLIHIENEYVGSFMVNGPDQWWTNISINKNQYLPDDTIRLWGILKKREGPAFSGPVKVLLTKPYWDQGGASVTTYAETELQVSDFGTITGELEFSDLNPGYYQLTFKSGEETITTRNFEVATYVKPAYRISLVPDRSAVFVGQPLTFKARAEFFDGTPVGNISLSYSTYGTKEEDRKGIVLLNEFGEGSFTVTPLGSSNAYSWYGPSLLDVTIKPTTAEEGNISSSAYVYVFNNHIHNTIEQSRSGNQAVFDLRTRQVVLPSTLSNQPFWSPESYLGGAVIGSKTAVTIVEQQYIQNQVGTGYDPINKVTYPKYNYTIKEIPVSLQTIVTDGSGHARLTFTAEARKVYKVTFVTPDGFGHDLKDERYYYSFDQGIYTSLSEEYNDEAYYTLFDGNNKSYKVGERIDLVLRAATSGQSPLPGTSKFIFLTVHNGDMQYTISNSPEYHGIFKETDIPNVGVWPGWFSKGRFHNGYVANISFDADERRLNVRATPNKSTFVPGEDVTLDVTVTDKDNRPVKAEVNLSALDEAVFSVEPGEEDLTNNLYRDIYSAVMIRASNAPPYGGGGAEKGGGGDDAARSDIREMALYKSVETDSNGKARVTFKLPDNITSWRITTQAVTQNLFAGKNVSFLPVSLPFFVDATLNESYLDGDNLLLRMRTFGAGAGANTTYTLESATLPFKKTTVVGGTSIEVPIGKLSLGKHTITIRATRGSEKDAITREINVVNSYFTRPTQETFEIVPGLTVKNDAAGETTLSFQTGSRGRAYGLLQELACGCGLRLDQKMTRGVALSLLNQYFDEKHTLPEMEIGKYQTNDGGFALLPYSDSDLELSALAAHILPLSQSQSDNLKRYFTTSLGDKKADPSRITRALYGLSAFKVPVLTKIESIKNDKSLTVKDQLFVALALDSLGAKEAARSYYNEKIAPDISTRGIQAYVNLGGDEGKTASALAAALTASLGNPVAEKLALYATENRPKETLVNFELLLYVQTVLPRLADEDVSITYSVGGREETVDLSQDGASTIVLSKTQLPTFKIVSVTGPAALVSSYEHHTSPVAVGQPGNLSLLRTYSVDGQVKRVFQEGDLVRISFDPRFGSKPLQGSYTITDYAPSGLRPADDIRGSWYYYDSRRLYPTEIENQKVTFVVSPGNTVPIYYYARVVTKGTYAAEPALLQSVRDETTAAITNEDTITVE